MKASDDPRAPGFTLLELLVVMVVLALVMATVLLRWSGVHHRAVVQSAVDRLELVDQHLRHFARSRGRPCGLELDLSRHRTRKLYGGHEDVRPAWESLGQGVRLVEARIGPEKAAAARIIEVPFDRGGVSPTWGLHLAGPGGEDIWLAFAGVSGQMTHLETEGQWHATFDLTAPTGL